LPPPQVFSLGTTTGPTTGGTAVLVIGANFAPGITLTLGGVAAPVTLFGPGTLQFSTPPGLVGPADLVVANLDGQAALRAGAFVYQAPTPTVTPTTYLPPAVDLWFDDFSDNIQYNSAHSNDLGLYTGDDSSMVLAEV
jgi:hypothetical protein